MKVPDVRTQTKRYIMAKKIEAYIKLQVPAQEANPSPLLDPLWASMA